MSHIWSRGKKKEIKYIYIFLINCKLTHSANVINCKYKKEIIIGKHIFLYYSALNRLWEWNLASILPLRHVWVAHLEKTIWSQSDTGSFYYLIVPVEEASPDCLCFLCWVVCHLTTHFVELFVHETQNLNAKVFSLVFSLSWEQGQSQLSLFTKKKVFLKLDYLFIYLVF